MEKDKYRWSEGIDNDLDQALTENAVAQLRYNAMTEEERQKFRRRAEGLRGEAEMKALVDELVGFQIGHPPYQL